jgi:hypothetical protein
VYLVNRHSVIFLKSITQSDLEAFLLEALLLEALLLEAFLLEAFLLETFGFLDCFLDVAIYLYK